MPSKPHGAYVCSHYSCLHQRHNNIFEQQLPINEPSGKHQKTKHAQQFAEWLETALLGGAGQAHRITKQQQIAEPPPLAVQQTLDEERQAWSERWQRDHAELQHNRERLNKIRMDMIQDDTAPMHLATHKLQQAVRKTRAYAGKGPDQIGKDFALALPTEGWQELTSILQLVIGLGILPLTMLQSWVALIPKPQGGLRPIALLLMTYRWLLKVY